MGSPSDTRKEGLSPASRREFARQQHLAARGHQNLASVSLANPSTSTREEASIGQSTRPVKRERSTTPQTVIRSVKRERTSSPQNLTPRLVTRDRLVKEESASSPQNELTTGHDSDERAGPASVRSSLRNASLAGGTSSFGEVAYRPQQPQWYASIKPASVRARGKYPATVDHTFSALKDAISRCEKAAADRNRLNQSDLDKIAKYIHEAFFIEFNNAEAARIAIRKNRLMHNEDGLPRLFHELSLRGFEDRPEFIYPFYIIADARELYVKWWRGIFDTSLYRGINVGRVKNEKMQREGSASRLQPGYADRVEGKFFGNGHLLNGQWWPHQLCALRDGAHHSAQGGIAGDKAGAWSIILAGDPKYPDVDEGEKILYCGTAGANGQPTRFTQYMNAGFESTGDVPVRVIRSEKCKNATYRPAKGYRYDGLYKIVGRELLSSDKAHYRYTLVRIAGQDPIRYQGQEARPTPQELQKFGASKGERRFLV